MIVSIIILDLYSALLLKFSKKDDKAIYTSHHKIVSFFFIILIYGQGFFVYLYMSLYCLSKNGLVIIQHKKIIFSKIFFQNFYLDCIVETFFKILHIRQAQKESPAFKLEFQ